MTANGDKFQTYNWQDETPVAGNNFYRLKKVVLYGTSKFSAITIVETATKKGTLDIYPTRVVQNTIHHQLINHSFGKYQVSLVTNDGKLLY